MSNIVNWFKNLHPYIILILLFVNYFSLWFIISCFGHWFINEPFDGNWKRHFFTAFFLGLLYLISNHWNQIKKCNKVLMQKRIRK